MCPAHEVKGFGIRRPALKKSFESVASVFKLRGSDIGCPNLAPDFMLGVRRIAGDYLLEVSDCISESLLPSRDASQLVMGVDFVIIYLHGPFKPFARRVKLSALLVDQTKIVVGRGICRIQGRCFQVLPERLAGTLRAAFSGWLDVLFAPAALPTSIPRLVLFVLLVGVAALAISVIVSGVRARSRRRTRPTLMWRLLGSPLTSGVVVARTLAELWNLIRGAAPIAAPRTSDLARRYVELLSDNLGQPGFRELLVTVHDMDARRDIVFALLGQTHRPRFFGRPGAPESAGRYLETFDLAGVSRDHAFDALAAALALPVATEPHLATFSAEGPWRGETHRLCDRPASLGRLLQEVAAAGAEQVILASAASPAARAHELSTGRADLRGRAGESLGSFEAADLRDVLEDFDGRFAGLFVIRPPHNPLGPLDFAGVYDERSDRIQSIAELLDRGYEDAYRQFIEPIVGAGGERIEVQPGNGNAGRRVKM